MKKLKKISVIGIGPSGRGGYVIRAIPQPWIDANQLQVGDMVYEATTSGEHRHMLLLDARHGQPRAGTPYVVQKNIVLSLNKEWCEMQGVTAKDKLQAYMDDFDCMWLEPV